jgi:hypothetical protein
LYSAIEIEGELRHSQKKGNKEARPVDSVA